jgi:CHAT domain-containing protein
MNARFARPAGVDLSVEQRQLVAAILSFMGEGDYDIGRLVAGRAPYVERMKQVCATDATRAPMIEELERWVRWQRVPAYWLAFILQEALNGVPSAHAITSRRIYADAQINLNDDLGLLSLENAFLVADKINARNPDPGIQAAALAVSDYIRKIYLIFRNWYSSRPYASIEPLSEHLYNLRMFLDLQAAFPDLRAGDAIHSDAWTHTAELCAPEEYYFRVIARRCAGWALEKADNTGAALEQYDLALSEATACGLETEICHLLRYSANVLRRLNQLDEAEVRLRLAIKLESHPELVYWQALSWRELGRVLVAKGQRGKEPGGAMEAFNEGREAFDISMVSSAVPVARAVKEQIFRSYSDDAVEEALTVSPRALLSEIEAAGPRYATDLMVESLLARQLPAADAVRFRRARAAFAEHRSLFTKENDENEQDFIAYISAVKQHSQQRDYYVSTRRRFGNALPDQQRSTGITGRVQELTAGAGAPDLLLLFFHLAEKRTYAVLVDVGSGSVTQESIEAGLDFWRACSDAYHADLADAMASVMSRNQRLEAAVGDMLAKYQEALGPLLEKLSDRLVGKRLKILPRLGLSEVPLHALTCGGRPLIQLADISYAPTLGSLLALQPLANTNVNPDSVTVVHDEVRAPAYTATLRAMRSYGPGEVDLVDPPTSDRFLAQVADRPPRDLFFACHGHYDLNDPRSSALLLTAKEEASFTRLFAELNLVNCRSVLMGACESGLGRTLVAAEYVGLPLAFLSCGVPYVIGTLWQVNQVASAMLVGEHYQLLLAGKHTVPQALNAAQRYVMALTQDEIVAWISAWLPEKGATWEAEIRKRGERPFCHPYYWAGFYLTGAA